jgi:DNA (cytosine-5)-methyltransferase 1
MSLFAGIGGIDLGLERAGMRVVAHSEIEPYACRVLRKHWPDVPNIGSVVDADFAAWRGRVDVIAGGFPCQDISLSGKGAGIKEGTRSGLWIEYARAVREIRPRYVLVENVAALTSRGLDRVLGDLAALGYDAEWDCISAASVGAPHVRERLFVVAYADGAQREGGGVPCGVGSQDADAGDACGLGAGVWPEPLRSSRWGSWPRKGGGWDYPPGVQRSADGVPHRMDRLRCLGNAVVPQVAEHVARIIVDHDRLRPTPPA